MEPLNLQKQLKVLGEFIDGKKQKPQKGPNISPNVFAAAAFGSFAVGVISLLAFSLISVLNLETKSAITIGIVIIIINKIANSMQIDRVHATISSLKDRFRK